MRNTNLKSWLKMIILIFVPTLLLTALGANIILHFELKGAAFAAATIAYATIAAYSIVKWMNFLCEKDIL